MKKILLFLAVIYSLSSTAQNVNIPDANFKAYLVGNTNINTNLDTEIQVTEAAAITGLLDLSMLSIADLTGIEAFTAIADLNCYNNSLTSLDVSANTALTVLYCNFNSLTSLDVSANTAFTTLDCSYNSLTSLNVSNTALTALYCNFNSLTSLDVSSNTALTTLNCGTNSLASLDVSANTSLTGLYCRSNSLTSLDVSANTALTILDCWYNSLTSLDVSANTALTNLGCSYNSLTSFDVSANTALTYLECNQNSLTSLDVQNGNNINFIGFNAVGNPSLNCIEVDDVTWATNNWTVVGGNIDVAASFSENCSVGMNDFNNSFLIVYPNPAIITLTIETPTAKGIYQLHDVTGKVLLSGNVTSAKFNLDISAFSKGIYFLSLFDDEHEAHRKIVKE